MGNRSPRHDFINRHSIREKQLNEIRQKNKANRRCHEGIDDAQLHRRPCACLDAPDISGSEILAGVACHGLPHRIQPLAEEVDDLVGGSAACDRKRAVNIERGLHDQRAAGRDARFERHRNTDGELLGAAGRMDFPVCAPGTEHINLGIDVTGTEQGGKPLGRDRCDCRTGDTEVKADDQ